MRCGIMVGIDGGHEKGSLTFAYVCWKSFREGKVDFLMVPEAGPGGE